MCHPERVLSPYRPVDPRVPEPKCTLGGGLEAAVLGFLGGAGHQRIDGRSTELGVAGRALEPRLGEREALPLDRPEPDPPRAARADQFRAGLALHAAVVVAALGRQPERTHEPLPSMVMVARSTMVQVTRDMGHLVRDRAVEPFEPLVPEHVERELDVPPGRDGQASRRSKPGAEFDRGWRTKRLAQRLFARAPPVADALVRQAFPVGTEDGDGSAHHAVRNG
jgi:hypothetical protein